MRKWSTASVLVTALSLLGAGVSAQRQAEPSGEYVPGEILVKFNTSLPGRQRDDVLRGTAGARVRRFEALGIDLVQLPPGQPLRAALQSYRAQRGVELVEPNYVRHEIQMPSPPNDPFWTSGSLWNLQKIRVQPVWTNLTPGDGSVVVASLDTGVNYAHPDLAANMWRNVMEIPGNGIDDDNDGYVDDVFGINALAHSGDPMDDQGHGTHTAGTIAAVGNNDLGVVGVSWNTKVLACKFLDASGAGSDAGAIECFNYLLMLRNRGENIRVTSNSWGQSRGSGAPSAILRAAIDAAGDEGVLNVFGAGNAGTSDDVWAFDPASYPSPSIVSVASSSPNDGRSPFTNYGGTSVDLAAPGENVLSTWLGDGYQAMSGTSVATPHVAGVAALVAQMNPNLSVADVKSILLDTVDHLPAWSGMVRSGGRLNASRAANAASPADNAKPTVAIVSPLEGATPKVPATIAIEAVASDSDGSIRHVVFYVNGQYAGKATASPYRLTLGNLPLGTYTLTAVAVDNLYGMTVSGDVHLTVVQNAPPVVSLTAPVDGAAFTSPASIVLGASAADSDGSVTQVAFYGNGALVGTDTTAPYGMTWTGVTAGTYALTAVATDNDGATATSQSVTVTVNAVAVRMNVALASNGAMAFASSVFNSGYPTTGAINGDRKGVGWGSGGGWCDGSSNTWPDWLEVDFAGLKTIDEVDVFTMQDTYTAPLAPTPAMTFNFYGLKNFEVQVLDRIGLGGRARRRRDEQQARLAPVHVRAGDDDADPRLRHELARQLQPCDGSRSLGHIGQRAGAGTGARPIARAGGSAAGPPGVRDRVTGPSGPVTHKIHATLRMSPAMAAGVTDRLWDVADFVDLLIASESTKAV